MDILYIGFSTGLSATCESGRKAAERLAPKFPGRTIRVIDSLSASAGEGLFVYLAAKNRDAGMTLEPGTVIATGTPSGVAMGMDPPSFLKDGDEVICEIEGIGRLVNICRK